jgi:UV DNA damage endonuclease
MNRRYGYCCINLSLAGAGVSTNRGMIRKTFDEKGMGYVSDLTLLNVKDLKKVIQWNSENEIFMYRMSSDIFPWCSEYEISELKDFEEIKSILKEVGDLAKSTDQRITFHPSPYGVLASDRPDVVKKAIKEISQHGEIMDLMGLDRTHFYPINIHVNTTKPTKEEAAARFCENFQLLPDSAKMRLVVEVDDKKSQYNAQDLFDLVHEKIGIPITFDYLHNKCNPHSNLTEEQALELCLSTWKTGIPAITHYSDSRRIFEDESAKEVAHSDWIYNEVPTYGMDFSIEFETKMKDLSLLKYLKEFSRN